MKETKFSLNSLQREFNEPSRNEWIVTIGTCTYIYDPWRQKYYIYKLGTGLLDDLDSIVADENSEYYKTVLKTIDDNVPVPGQPRKPLKQKYKTPSVDKKTITKVQQNLPAGHHICYGCGKVIIVTGPKATNLLLCPRCNGNISEERSKRFLEQKRRRAQTQHNTRKQSAIKRLRKRKTIKSRRQKK